MQKSSGIKQIVSVFVLWLSLTLFFSLINSSTDKYEMLIQAINSALFTSGYYFSYHILIKHYLYKGKTRLFILFYFLVTVGLSMVSILLVYRVYILADKKFFIENYWNEPVFFTSNYVLMLLVTSSLLSFRFLKDRMQTQILLENVEKEKISTELSFLKAQINPHFLFNSLNNILFQIDKSNPDARETLLKFSEVLRYQLYECSNDLVAIEKELQYIQNYIQIQMLRKTDRYDCELTVSPSVNNFEIAPLLLIPFIENAFKHLSHHTTSRNCIRVNMDYRSGKFYFSVSNDKDQLTTQRIQESKGIGLANVKRRLDLLYPGKHHLAIEETDNHYKASLELEVG